MRARQLSLVLVSFYAALGGPSVHYFLMGLLKTECVELERCLRIVRRRGEVPLPTAR